MPNGIVYDGNKKIEQSSFRVCYECSSKIQDIDLGPVSEKFCAGCSSVVGDRRKQGVPDFASFIITIIEKITDDALISRYTRAKEVNEKAKGVKMSRGVSEPYDQIQAHVYSNRTDIEYDNEEKVISEISSTLKEAYDSITRLPNFEADMEINYGDDFTDVYIYFNHENAPN